MTNQIFLIIVCAALCCIICCCFFYRREKKLLDRIQAMIDAASSGTLTREDISENKLSAVENSLKRYLDDSILAAENQSQQKQMIESLISDIAHQTLTPVSNLKIYAELWKETNNPTIPDTILEQTDKLDFLIQSLVKLSRMENGIISAHPQPTELSLLFDRLTQQALVSASQKELVFTVCPTSLRACFDLKWTAEAIGNIVDNAIKYTPCGGHVTLHAQTYSLFVRIDITDDGIGIAEEDLPNIFTRFYRSLAAADYPGVGIGLYLSREIIQSQQGYIKVSSTPGKGTVFSVFLRAVQQYE